MIDLKAWLEDLGLAHLAPVFAAHDVDFDVLTGLAETDLAKIGLSLGHRRRILKALADRGPSLPLAAATSVAPGPVHANAAEKAERRRVTVMFCDLVGSTELANLLDPEDMGALIRRFQEACTTAVARCEGIVAKFMGDGVLACFGYPEAHEDDARQCVRSALGIVEALADGRRPEGRRLVVRVGIATGLVVVGDIIGEGAAREQAIVGQTPNLAARLQGLALPDQILVSESTRQLLGRQFELAPLDPQILKGFDKPVRVWRVLREAAVESRFAAIHSSATSPLVGRTQEMSHLLDGWASARRGVGRLVVILGEAGMGKSRLVDALTTRIAAEPHSRVLCQCSPYHTNSALFPVIRRLERAAGFAEVDSTHTKLAKLRTLLTATAPDVDTMIGPMADLLSLGGGGEPGPAAPSAAQRKAATIAALIEHIGTLAAQKPLLLVLEDAHWIDPTTRDLVTRLIGLVASLPILVVVTARPEFVVPWDMATPFVACALSRLSNAQSADLVQGMPAAVGLTPSLIQEIVAKADGIPLFIEELTKAVTEDRSLDNRSVPATLHDSLMARLDRLGPAKEIAQVAAVIGLQFSRPLLAIVAIESPAGVDAALAQLVTAGLMVALQGAGGADFRFSHALMRDVAYENLLRGRRRQVHERIGRTLVESFPATAGTEPEVVAHHFAHAALPELAALYAEHAGDRAVVRSAFAEAVAHFSAARDETVKLPDGRERVRRELALALKLGPALSIIRGPQSAEVESTYHRAHDAGVEAEDGPALFKATWGLWFNAIHRRALDKARDYADELVTLGAQLADADLQLEASHCRWSTASFRGECTTALTVSARGALQYEPARHRWMGPVFGGHDPGVCAHAVHSLALCQAGYTAQAKKAIDASIALAESLGNPHNVGFALLNALTMYQMQGERAVVEVLAERLTELSARYNFPPMRAHALVVSGWARATGGDPAAGLAVLEAEYPAASALGPFFRFYAALLAEARLDCGQSAAALELVCAALATVTEPGVGVFVPELHRLHGLCRLQAGPDAREEAVQSLRAALRFARRGGARLFALRAALALARLAEGNGGDDRATLREVVADLPAEFRGAELDQATALLPRPA